VAISSTNLDQHTQTAVPFMDLQAQHRALSADIRVVVDEVLTDCNFILGRQVREFEQAFAAYIGVAHAVGVSNGLDALRIALAALDIGPGDEVIVPANTYIATALAASALGARVVLVDCDASTYNIDPNKIERAITARTRVVIPVHLTGQPADMAPILEIAERRGLQVLEDAAQAHGARYQGQPCGSMGIAGCFSFYPAKNLGAAGDGGMIVTQNGNLAQRARKLSNYGEVVKYQHTDKGLNARLDTLHAAILQVKLPHLDGWNQKRAQHAQRYRERLARIPDIGLQAVLPDCAHVYHLFMVQTSRRDALRQFLQDRGVQTGIHYPTPIHLQPAYADHGWKKGDYPVAEELSSRIVSLPMFPELRDEQIDYVCEQISEFVTAQS
jgi:dTDP-4-amino-4,6-dideoxygalactose transaminase